jgi:hypothetical protein
MAMENLADEGIPFVTPVVADLPPKQTTADADARTA